MVGHYNKGQKIIPLLTFAKQDGLKQNIRCLRVCKYGLSVKSNRCRYIRIFF